MRIGLLFFALFFSTLAFPASFEGKRDFSYHEVYGSVKVYCHHSEVQSSHFYNCSDYRFNPGSHFYFIHDTKLKFVKVELKATHEDGSEIIKTYKWNNNKKRSSKRVNLLISSIFQSPLLHNGINVISYRFQDKDDNWSESEQFDVIVNQNLGKRCPYGVVFARLPNVCNNAILSCREYFYKYSSCE